MNLYLTTGTALDGARACWTGTQLDAKAAERAYRSEDVRDVHTEPIDVPTDKAGLLEFLNKHQVGRTDTWQSVPVASAPATSPREAAACEIQTEPGEVTAPEDSSHDAQARIDWHRLRAKRAWLPETVSNVFYEFVKARGQFGDLVAFARRYR